MTDDWYRVVAGGVLIATTGISIGYRARAELRGGAAPDQSRGDLSRPARFVAGATIWGAMLLPLLAPGLTDWARIPLPAAVRVVGVALGLLGVPAMRWTMRSLGTNVSHTTGTRAGASLVTHGPYRWVRHPLYTTGLNLFLASALMLESGIQLAVFLVAALWIPSRAAREEEYLRASYGQRYQDYQRRSGRFLPRIIRR